MFPLIIILLIPALFKFGQFYIDTNKMVQLKIAFVKNAVFITLTIPTISFPMLE